MRHASKSTAEAATAETHAPVRHAGKARRRGHGGDARAGIRHADKSTAEAATAEEHALRRHAGKSPVKRWRVNFNVKNTKIAERITSPIIILFSYPIRVEENEFPLTLVDFHANPIPILCVYLDNNTT